MNFNRQLSRYGTGVRRSPRLMSIVEACDGDYWLRAKEVHSRVPEIPYNTVIVYLRRAAELGLLRCVAGSQEKPSGDPVLLYRARKDDNY